MCKIALSFVSFVVGALIGPSLFSGIHTSTLVQIASAANIAIGGAKSPVVDPIDPKAAANHIEFRGGVGEIVLLDGLNCEGCVFEGSEFEYGGGFINCPNCQFLAPEKTILLSGAAFNTLKFLQSLQAAQAVPKDLPPPPKEQNPKYEIKLSPQTPKTMNLVILAPTP